MSDCWQLTLQPTVYEALVCKTEYINNTIQTKVQVAKKIWTTWRNVSQPHNQIILIKSCRPTTLLSVENTIYLIPVTGIFAKHNQEHNPPRLGVYLVSSTTLIFGVVYSLNTKYANPKRDPIESGLDWRASSVSSGSSRNSLDVEMSMFANI